MNKNILMTACKLILMINIFFWTFISINLAFSVYYNFIPIQILLLCQPILFVCVLIGLMTKNKYLYILSLLFVSGNTLLSFTDHMSTFDIIAFALSLFALLNLIMLKNHYSTQKLQQNLL